MLARQQFLIRWSISLLLIGFFGGAALLAQNTANPCGWEPGAPYKMHWPQLPDLSPAGVDVEATRVVLADDFRCTATGPITEIHLWASFAEDLLPSDGPGAMTLGLTIFSDIPAEANSWSRPGEPLWTRVFAPGQYTVRRVHDGPEGWYDPLTDTYRPANHRQAYQYSFCINEDEACVQEEGKVYWLALAVRGPANTAYRFGWKSTSPKLHWNDDAVYQVAGASWLPMTYPKDHEYADHTLDLAFVIGGDRQTAPACDLGDAPDSSNSYPGASMLAYPSGVVANYPTVYKEGSPPYGPIHRAPRAVVYLGDGVSLEAEADLGPDEDPGNNLLPPANAADMDSCDDGVLLPLALPHLEKAAIEYVVTVQPGAPTNVFYVNVWIDWNRDGDWNDFDLDGGGLVDEWVVSDQTLHLGAGVYFVMTPQFVCWHPPDREAEPLWMRITIAERPRGPMLFMVGAPVEGLGSGFKDGYQYGETEDYLIYPREKPGYDWGDAPDGYAAPGYPTLSGNGGAHHVMTGPWLGDKTGAPDAELDGQPDLDALGDDNDGNDDEEGIAIPPLVAGEIAVLSVKVGGGGGIVQGWIDFNGDMIWQAVENVFDGFLPEGEHLINVSVPSAAVAGRTFARFRISRKGGLSPAGAARDGEVEDYAVDIRTRPPNNKWVQWPDLTPNGIDIRVDEGNRLADDFECTSTNRITEIYLWGSWKHDLKGRIEKVHVSIHPDDPVGPGGQDPDNRFSKPQREVLWSKSFTPGEFNEKLYHIVTEPGEWWWDPANEDLIRGGDTEVWRLELHVSPREAFLQQGSPTNPVIYWLSVEVKTTDGQFGWKTRRWPDHYMDDAVRSAPGTVVEELRYPKGHPYYTLDKNSIDLAFQLDYTAEIIEYPTMRPGSVTHCPAVETQCPAVETRCPPISTQCPTVDTRCPTVSTKCPAVATQCPIVATNCPPTLTRCPTVATRCPTALTQCPAILTRCPAEQTKCPPFQTKCPVYDTRCPAEQTRCPAVSTECPPALTKCPPTPTECTAVDTQCPPVDTQCPPVYTKCPPSLTKCPVYDTRCPAEQTRCPAVSTECPPALTKCPPTPTECTAVDTQCPPVDTQCPPVYTKCPPSLTKCPVYDTRCPAEQTRCPAVSTECPPALTKCPPTPTECTAVDTQCPPVDTQCPPVYTKCPPSLTKCPVYDTRCPAEQTRCPAVSTECPPALTKCPPTPTECTAVDTQCPPVYTKCPPSQTKCPVYDTRCPGISTECPPALTKCPPTATECIAVQTECPPVQTECPPLFTRCPATPTQCIQLQTQCPAIETQCPPVDTSCPVTLTMCPPVLSRCPPTVTFCTPACQPVLKSSRPVAVCPAIDAICPSIVPAGPPGRLVAVLP